MTNLIDIIKQRKSCRTYLNRYLNTVIKEELEQYVTNIGPGLFGERIQFKLVEKPADKRNEMKLNYGMIVNHNTYILGTSKSTCISRVNYGYLLEKVVLKATALGLATCWIGYFDSDYFTEIKTDKVYEIPSIIIVGYAADKSAFGDKFARFKINASKRNAWNELFYLNDSGTPLTVKMAGKYDAVLEMVRLAPSSGNTQPWRIFKETERNTFHFYKKVISARYEKKGLHDIDIGICLAHFELTAKFQELEGKWQRGLNTNKIYIPDDLQYIVSWIGNE